MEKPQQKSKSLIYLVIIALLLLGTLGGVYYYMTMFSGGELDDLSEKIEANLKQEATIAKSELDAKDTQIQLLKAQSQNLKKEQENIANKLAYTIKPKEKIVAQCVNMKIGKWKMPQSCLDELKSGVLEMLKNDNKIVAFEISGVVDTLPYGGTSPELKQEGLASFRAREAIIAVSAQMPSVAAFEGLSQQKPRERGFIIRAFYVEQS